jgi:hypothetical protein
MNDQSKPPKVVLRLEVGDAAVLLGELLELVPSKPPLNGWDRGSKAERLHMCAERLRAALIAWPDEVSR